MSYEKVAWPPKWQVMIIPVIGVLIYLLTVKYAKGANIFVVLGLFIVLYVVGASLFTSWKCDNKEKFDNNETIQPVCTQGCNSSNNKLMQTSFNLRECTKQMILLEDHLNVPDKDCYDCQRKHFLNIEALAEEGEGLNGTDEDKKECEQLAVFIRECSKKLASGYDKPTLAQEIRKIRKPLMYKYFDKI